MAFEFENPGGASGPTAAHWTTFQAVLNWLADSEMEIASEDWGIGFVRFGDEKVHINWEDRIKDDGSDIGVLEFFWIENGVLYVKHDQITCMAYNPQTGVSSEYYKELYLVGH